MSDLSDMLTNLAALTDLDEMLRILAAERNRADFSASTSPTKTEVINWINDGVVDTVRRLLPRRLRSGEYTEGRLDKLTKLIGRDDINIETSGDPLTDGTYLLSLPTDTNPMFYFAVRFGVTGSEARAKEVPFIELCERGVAGKPEAATAADPLYSWANATWHYRPQGYSALTPPYTRVLFYFVAYPTPMVEGTADQESFKIDKDLIPTVLEYVMFYIWAQKSRNKSLAQVHLQEYLKRIAAWRGKSSYRVRKEAI